MPNKEKQPRRTNRTTRAANKSGLPTTAVRRSVLFFAGLRKSNKGVRGTKKPLLCPPYSV